ncbi:MAG: DUF1189 family protein [Alphaproteobacteria bacterium]
MFDVLKSLPESFYSQNFYRNVIRNQKGLGRSYIVVLILLLCLHVASSLYAPTQKIQAMIPEFFSGLPEMTLRDGKFTSIDKPMPFFLKLDPTSADTRVFAIDTNQKMDDQEALRLLMEQKNIFVLLAADRLAVYHAGRVEVSPLNLQNIDVIITRDHWGTVAASLGSYVYPIYGLIVFIGALCGGLLRAFLGGLIALLLSLPLKSNLDYTGGVRLAAATAIPCMIFILLLPLRDGTFYPLWMAYMLFALWSNKILGTMGTPKA